MTMTHLRTHITEQLRRGTVMQVDDAGGILVLFGDREEAVRCSRLVVSDDDPLTLHPGDSVLVWGTETADEAVVVGRIGPAHGERAPDEAPAVLTIEAKQSLTLRVGDGSITIRDDGKILIKGKDLVSHAQRLNRIKGGSVSIN